MNSWTSPVDIRPDHLAIVQEILRVHLPAGFQVWVFGSRANWTTKDSSDLDLAVEGAVRLNHKAMVGLEVAFEESDLPYTVDVVDLKAVSSGFRRTVEDQRLALPLHDQAGKDEWETASWGDLATLEYGKSLRGYESSEGPYRVYGTNGPIGWCNEPLCFHPSVIIGRKGAYRGVHYSATPFFVIDTAFYLRPKVEIDIRWAYYQLLTQDINGMDSGSAIPSTSREDFYGLPVKVPPLAEQRTIAHVLGTLDDKIELNRRMNRTLEEMARAIFQDWFVDFGPTRAKKEGLDPYLPPELWDLFPEHIVDSELGEIPEGWEWKTVKDCFDLTMGQSPPGSTYNDHGDGLPFFQGSTDFGARFPANRRFCSAPARTAQRDDTLISVRAPIGDMNMAWERCCIGRGVAALRHKSGASSFTYHSSQSMKPEIQVYEQTGTVFGAITKKQFESVPFLDPQGQLLERFEALVQPLDQRIRSSTDAIASITAQRDALLPKLMSGELKPQEREY